MKTRSETFVALPLAVGLFQSLNERDVRYCHWKSTPGLAGAMSGQTDLDILVDRSDGQVFRQILGDFDFKPLTSHPSRQFPAVEDYLGFDRSSGGLVHLHVQYRLILGEQHVKSYCLPLEQTFLRLTEIRDGVKVPVPELELIVLVLRALLKYRDRDFLRDVLGLGRSGGLRPSILRELRSLLAMTDLDDVLQVLQDEVDFVSPGLIVEFLTTIQKAPRSAWTLRRLRSQARRELAPFRRHGALRARLTYAWLVLTTEGPLPRIFGGLRDAARNRKCPASGGITVAFVGADGAGKSTVTERIARWLSWKLSVRVHYMGVNQPSPPTRGLKTVRRLIGLGHAGCRRLFGENSAIARLIDVPRQLAISLLSISQARDRYARYAIGRRQAAAGAIVIYDRYPLPDVYIAAGPIDGPRVSSTSAVLPAGLARAVSRLERGLYDGIRPADHYFVLHVDPAKAHQRKPDHKRTTVDANALAIELMAADGPNQTHVDADQPLEQVLLDVKSALWRLL